MVLNKNRFTGSLPFGVSDQMLAPGSKNEMYKLYYAEAFGNQLLSWPDIDSYLASGYNDPVVLRYRVKESKFSKYNLTREGLLTQVEEWCREGAKRELFTVNELSQDDQLTIQGEIRRSTAHLSMSYSLLPMPMRTALRDGIRYAEGLRCEAILKHYLDDVDYEFLLEQLGKYQGVDDDLEDPLHNVVVEFSVWAHKVGTWHRRMVVWEVRAGY